MYNPYNWVRDDFSYYIETDNQVPYRAYFENETARFGDYGLGYPIYSFSIEVVGDRDITQVPEDKRIADTICKLLTEFFQNDENVLIVVYDTLDGRGAARQRKFNRWFDQCHVLYVEKRDYVIVDEDVEMPNSLFIHTDHPFKLLIVDAYQRLVDNGGYL